jgi:hypothetical protein
LWQITLRVDLSFRRQQLREQPHTPHPSTSESLQSLTNIENMSAEDEQSQMGEDAGATGPGAPTPLNALEVTFATRLSMIAS